MRPAALVVLALSAAGASDPPAEEVFRQFWRNPRTAAWEPIGLMTLTRTDRGPVLAAVPFSYAGRDSAPADKVRGLKLDDRGMTFAAEFKTADPKPVVLDFALTRDGDAYAGPVTRGGKPFGETKLVRLSGPAAVRKELAAVADALRVEKRVSERLVPQLRENLTGWERRLDQDRKDGRATTGTPTALQAAAARAALTAEEGRVGVLEARIAEATAALTRAEAAADAGKK